MAKSYTLRGRVRLDKGDIIKIKAVSKGRYILGPPKWNEGESFNENGWCYEINCFNNLINEDLKLFKEKGLTLLLTEEQEKVLCKRLGIPISERILYPIEIVNNANLSIQKSQ